MSDSVRDPMTPDAERDAWRAIAANLGQSCALLALDERLDADTRAALATAHARQVAAHFPRGITHPTAALA